MAILTIFFTLLFAFILWRSIVGAGRTAARATQEHARLTQAQTQMFYDAMTPEAKTRVVEAKQARIATARADQRERLAIVGVALLVFALVFSVFMIVPAPAQVLYGDPYDGARIAQRYTSPRNVFYRSPTLQDVYGWGGAPFAYAPPLPPPTPIEPNWPAAPPPPIGWVYRYYAPCADPDCSTLRVAVGADGLNVRTAPGGWVTGALANGVPLVPLQKQGDWVLVAPACPLAPTFTWSWTAGVPLSVCL